MRVVLALGMTCVTGGVLGSVVACGTNGSGGEASSSSSSSGGGTPDAGMTVDCTGRPSASPSIRSELGGVLDPIKNRLVVFGGNNAVAMMCNVPQPDITDEVWAFQLDCNNWEQLNVVGPSARARFATVYDSQRNRMLIFGGRERRNNAYINLREVWAFDLATDTWTEITTSGTAPPARSSPAAVYDATRDRLIIFGGNSSTSGLTLTGINDAYALDLATNTWSALSATGAPSPRLYHAAVVLDREMLVYGGTPNFDGPYHEDTYALNLDTDTWRLVSATGPESRFGAELFADAVQGRVYMFGGHDGTNLGNRNDVWVLNVGNGVWSNARPGDTLAGQANGQCDFPPDFTTIEPGAPERRYSFVHTQSATAGYIFAGKTDCGAVNDVWSLSLMDGTWTNVRPTTGGEACNRSGSLSCQSLCF